MTNKLLRIKNFKNAKKIIQNLLRIIYQIVMKVKLESQEIFLSLLLVSLCFRVY
jgi:hypothetical protein